MNLTARGAQKLSSDAVLQGFTLEGAGWGVHCKDAAPTIRKNIFRDHNNMSHGAITLEGPTYGSWGHSPATIINNTIINAAGGGILTSSTQAATVKNCVIAFNDDFGIKHTGPSNPGTKPILSYNCIYDNDSDYVNISDTGIGSFSSDPLVWSNGTLKFFSPCIDAGDPDSIYNDPDGSRNDIGGEPFFLPGPPPRRPKEHVAELPTTVTLSQNYPNPFNPATTIRFSLPEAATVKLEILNILGRRVATLVDRYIEAGEHDYQWNGTEAGSGVYLYRLSAGDFVESKKMILLK